MTFHVTRQLTCCWYAAAANACCRSTEHSTAEGRLRPKLLLLRLSDAGCRSRRAADDDCCLCSERRRLLSDASCGSWDGWLTRSCCGASLKRKFELECLRVLLLTYMLVRPCRLTRRREHRRRLLVPIPCRLTRYLVAAVDELVLRQLALLRWLVRPCRRIVGLMPQQESRPMGRRRRLTSAP